MKETRLDINQNSAGIYVYYFRNTGGNDCQASYVGSTTNFDKRHKEHTGMLKNGTHHNSHFQSAYNLYGDSNLEYEQLEQMSFPVFYDKNTVRDFLESREFYWYTQLGCRYNAVEPGEAVLKSLYRNGRNPSKSLKKLVYLVDKELNVIKEFSGIREAGRTLGIDSNMISKVARAQAEHTHGYFFRYPEFLNTKYKKKPIKKSTRVYLKKPVICYDLIGHEIKEFDSIISAAKELNIQESGINRCCTGEAKHAGEFVFAFKGTAVPTFPVEIKRSEKIICLRDTHFYQEFDNCNKAAKFLGLSRSLIHHRCNSKNSKAIGDFSFYYKSDFNQLNQYINGKLQ